MAQAPEVVAILRLDDTEAKKDAESFGKSLSKIGIGAAVAASAAALAFGLKKSVEAAMESEEAIRALNSAMAITGTFSKEASQSFQDFATGLQRTTGVSDELILKNSALLVSIGKLSGEGLQNATKAALDLAAGLQIDVGQAFDVVTKASQGNVGMLAKYGLEVNKAATDSEKFAQALSFIQQNFGGSALSGMQSFSGALTRMSNAFGDIFEETGKIFTQSKTLRAVIVIVAQAFEGVSDSIAGVAKSGDLLKPVFDGMIAFGKAVIDIVIKPMEAIGSFLATGISTIIAGVMTAVTPLAMIFDKLFKTDLSSSMETMKTNWQMTMVGMAEETHTNAASISTGLTESLTAFQENVTAQSQLINDEIRKTPEVLAESTAAQESFFAGFREGIEQMGKSIQNLGKQVAQTFVVGFSNAFAQMGKALVQGNNMFDAFGKAILSMLGNVAIQMGSFYIAAGIAAMFLPGGAARGAGLIAGGIGLSLLGGVLQALGGGGGGVGATAAGTVPGGGATIGAGGGSDMELASEQERVRPSTGVTVTIQGNVLDRRQTGLEIAEILNESFDTDGTTVRAVGGVV